MTDLLKALHLDHLRVSDLVDLRQPSLYVSLASIAFNPTVWNIVARHEHHNRALTRALGSPYRACYLMAICIFGFGILRDGLFEHALKQQPQTFPESLLLKVFAAALFVAGQILVISSTWALGVTGTYLGDYCGILQDAMVTGFPFNVQTDPMYNGSTMCFLGTALWYRRPAGILVAVFVYLVYQVALAYEGPFTSNIYAEREKSRQAGAGPAADKSTPSKSGPSYASAVKTYADGTPETPSGRTTRSRAKAASSKNEL